MNTVTLSGIRPSSSGVIHRCRASSAPGGPFGSHAITAALPPLCLQVQVEADLGLALALNGGRLDDVQKSSKGYCVTAAGEYVPKFSFNESFPLHVNFCYCLCDGLTQHLAKGPSFRDYVCTKPSCDDSMQRKHSPPAALHRAGAEGGAAESQRGDATQTD